MRKLYILLLILILALAACGGDSDDDSDSGDNGSTDTTEQTTDESTDTTDTEEATDDDTPEETTDEDADATEEADATDDDADATEEADATDDDADVTEEADATDDDTDTNEEADATDDDSSDDSEEASEGDDAPVVVSGFQTFEGDCPARFQFQYPPNWTINNAAGGRVIFTVATDSGDADAQFEYRGGVAPNQQESTQERFANAAGAEQVTVLTFDDVEYPVYREERSLSGGDVRYYQFILPGNFLIDNIRLVVDASDGGDFPNEDDVVSMISTIVPNRCN